MRSGTFAAILMSLSALTLTACQLEIIGEEKVSTDGAGNGGGGEQCPTARAVTVDAVYPTYGPNWNDYVRNEGSGTSAYDRDDLPCPADGTETGFFKCVHGGEKKKVVVSGISSCSGLSLSESLGAFDWICDDSSGTATFYSRNLKEGKGLKDLVDADGFLQNRVTLAKNGCTVAQSAQAVWWSNPVESLPANPLDSDPALTLAPSLTAVASPSSSIGTVYVVSSDTVSSGYNLNQDKVALVVLAGAKLSYSGNMTGYCSEGNGELSSGTTRSLLCSGGQKFLWVEGAFDGTASTSTWFGGYFYGAQFVRVHSVKSYWGEWRLRNSRSSLISDSRFSGTSWSPEFGVVSLYSTDYTTIARVTASHSGNFQVSLNYASDHNVLHQVLGSSSEYGGVVLANHGTGSRPTDNTLTLVHSSGSSDPIIVSGSYRTTLLHTAATLSSSEGVRISDASDYTTFANLTVASVSWAGPAILHSGGNNTRFRDVLIHSRLGSGYKQISVSNSSSVEFSGLFKTDHTECAVDGGTTSSIQLDNSCNYGASSTAPESGLSLDNSYVGAVNSDEVNQQDSAGTLAASSLTDWVNLESAFRLWGKEGSGVLADGSRRGKCNASSGHNCRIYDWRFFSDDTVARNLFGEFTNGAACPAPVDASVAANVMQDAQLPVANTFLVHAFEVVGDWEGDEDGLCESNESCIHAPNAGAYQGEGDFRARTCSFTGGNGVTGVRMHAYPVNGV